MPKVLVVEDDRFLVSAYTAKFDKVGITVAVARDGDEAFEVLKTFKADLILLDLVMPKKDGFAFLTDLRNHPELHNTPVVVATNLGQRASIDRVKELGVTEYIVKTSLSLDDLVKRINTLIAAKK